MVQVAFQQADYVAWNVWSAINGRPLLPFKYQHLGDMMSLGKAALPLLKGAGTMLPLAAWTSLLLLLQVAPQEQSEGVASSLQSGPLGSLLGAAGIRWGDLLLCCHSCVACCHPSSCFSLMLKHAG